MYGACSYCGSECVRLSFVCVYIYENQFCTFYINVSSVFAILSSRSHESYVCLRAYIHIDVQNSKIPICSYLLVTATDTRSIHLLPYY